MESIVGIALLGCGTVGGGVAEILRERRSLIERRVGARYALHGVARRGVDPFALIDDPRVDLVIECIGGTDTGLECIERALERGKHVVTANKDAIATQGPRLRALAAVRGVGLRYEAAVGSAIPVLGALGGALQGDCITEIRGILNGTCNAILSAMRAGATQREALDAARSA